jgi:transcriptional regulator with XRE-family HTH domain
VDTEKKRSRAVLIKAFGKRLKTLRKESGLSMEKLANKADLSKETIRALESGENDPRFTTLCRIAKSLGTTVTKLVDI